MRAKIVSNELEEKGYTQTTILPPPAPRRCRLIQQSKYEITYMEIKMSIWFFCCFSLVVFAIA